MLGFLSLKSLRSLSCITQSSRSTLGQFNLVLHLLGLGLLSQDLLDLILSAQMLGFNTNRLQRIA